MSRTKRKISAWKLSVLTCKSQMRWHYLNTAYGTASEPITKKDWALAQRDRSSCYGTSRAYYMNLRDRKTRAAVRRELQRVFAYSDYEDVTFDISDAEAYDKGIWWSIT